MEHAVQSDTSQHLVLWGHSLSDYQEMFNLDEADLSKKILDCFPGPASFNAQLHQQQRDITSCDDLFKLPHPDLENHITDVFQSMLTRVKKHESRFIWDNIGSMDDLARERQAGINQFLTDFDEGVEAGRYKTAKPKNLPFQESEFELALCSHYLFGNRIERDFDTHIAAILEMCRVATEVRLFPLLDSNGEVSPLVGPIMLYLQQHNMGVELAQVRYQFQKNGNAMLRIWALECPVD